MNISTVKTISLGGVANLNIYAACLSTLCILHCIALPLLVVLMPVLAQVAENELIHRVLVIAAIPMSLQVIWKTSALTQSRLFASIVLVGLGLLITAAFVEATERYEQPITVVGGLMLASAHIWHWLRKCGRGAHPEHACDTEESSCNCSE